MCTHTYICVHMNVCTYVRYPFAQVSSLMQTHELREVEAAKHLETVKQTHKQSVHKLRHDLVVQQRTSSRSSAP